MSKNSVVVLILDSQHSVTIENLIKKYAHVNVVTYTTRESVPSGVHINCVLVSQADIEHQISSGEKFFFKKIQDGCQPDTSIFVLSTNTNFDFFDKKNINKSGRKEYTILNKRPFLGFFTSSDNDINKTKKLLSFILTGSEEIPHRVEG